MLIALLPRPCLGDNTPPASVDTRCIYRLYLNTVGSDLTQTPASACTARIILNNI